MRVLVTGAAGMIGRKLTARLTAEAEVAGRTIAALDLHDVVPFEAVSCPTMHVAVHVGDLGDEGVAAGLAATKPDLVFHLASIVSGQAEADFDLGYRINLDGTRMLFDALRRAGNGPRVVFSSSMAVYGGPFPDVVPDDFHPVPLTSYGTQKLMSELLLGDYTRRGFLDGVSLRLPTICVRPGKPNKAASGFFSGIIREPLAGLPAVLPVPRTLVHTHASPRSAVGFLLHAAGLPSDAIGPRRSITLPGVAVSVGEQIEALARIGGEDAAAMIREEADPAVWAIVKDWPPRFEAARARALGFRAEESFDDIIRVYLEDDTGGVAS